MPRAMENPLKELVVSHAPFGNGQPDFYEFIVGALYRYAVHLKKREHDVKSDALIPVNERVVGDQRISETGAFFFFGRIELFVAKSGEGAFKRGIQQCHGDTLTMMSLSSE